MFDSSIIHTTLFHLTTCARQDKMRELCALLSWILSWCSACRERLLCEICLDAACTRVNACRAPKFVCMELKRETLVDWDPDIKASSVSRVSRPPDRVTLYVRPRHEDTVSWVAQSAPDKIYALVWQPPGHPPPVMDADGFHLYSQDPGGPNVYVMMLRRSRQELMTESTMRSRHWIVRVRVFGVASASTKPYLIWTRDYKKHDAGMFIAHASASFSTFNHEYDTGDGKYTIYGVVSEHWFTCPYDGDTFC